MDNKYLLTIAIPCYNRRELLKRTLFSILQQYTEDIEILISDNASTDGTDNMIGELTKSYPFLNYIKNKTNTGSDKNFLQCYEKAKGKYILLLGSDDVLHEGSINRIISFLKSNENMNLIFLNHNCFRGNYVNNEGCFNNYFKNVDGTYLTNNKNEFINIVKDRITFMSSTIALREPIEKLKDKEQFLGTYFIHVCLMLAATTTHKGSYGIIYYPCVGEDVTPENQGVNSFAFTVFGKHLKYVLCNIAIEYGFDEKIMNSIFCDYVCNTWPRSIGSRKAKGLKFKENFWKDGFPAINEYPRAWLTVMPMLLIPSFVFKAIIPIYRKFKENQVFK